MSIGGDMTIKEDIIDTDLVEEIDDEEMSELVKEAREKTFAREAYEKKYGKPKRRFPKWAFWLISLALAFNVVALLPQTLSIPAIEFLITSTELSKQDNIKEYKKSITVIETDDSKGTGFLFSNDGLMLTNSHVVDGNETVTVGVPEHGLFTGEVIDDYPDIDLAVVKIDIGEPTPHLKLAENPVYEKNEFIYFIGNPLKFSGIANKGNLIEEIHLKSWDQPVIAIDAPVYRGNSGSPVINQNGEVIGVIFATIDDDEIGKAGVFVPIDYFDDNY